MKKIKNDIMNGLVCELIGFKKDFKLKKNGTYMLNDSLIKSIFIDDSLEKMTVEFKDGVTYSKKREEIDIFLNQILFNLIIKEPVSFDLPNYKITDIYENGCLINDKTNNTIVIVSSCEGMLQKDAEKVYKDITQLPAELKKNSIKYERILKTFQNPNIIAQFMSLYQFLMELLQGDKDCVSQKDVIDYFTKNKDKYSFLRFSPTRRKGKNFDEDCFTYIRNEIGHCEETNDLNLYTQLGSTITQELIRQLVIVINDVIMS